MLALRSRFAAAVVLAAALAFAGCGADRDAYREDAQRAADRFRRSAEKAGAQIQQGKTLRSKAPAVRAFKDSVDTLAADFEKLDPPEDVEPLNDEAVRHMRALSADLDRYAGAAADGETRAARDLAPKLQTDQSQLESTLARLDKRISQD